MEKNKLEIQFCWVKAHVGIQGNELVDTLAKEAATNADIKECYKKVPKSVVISELSEINVGKWQTEWDQTTKAKITKEYFRVVADRLNMRINNTHNFTSMFTGHGNIRSYWHRFKVIDSPTCPCGTKDQTIDHLLFECELLNRERDSLKSSLLKTDIWPISKNILIRKLFQIFANLLTRFLLTNLTKC